MISIKRIWRRWFVMRTQSEIEIENRELRKLVAEMYKWTRYKNSPWARRAKKMLSATATARNRMAKSQNETKTRS